MCGSKYVQSDLNTTFPQIKVLLAKGEVVLFTGTPCQVAALKQYLVHENTSLLLLCDFICHGTPSPKLMQDYIAFINRKSKNTVVMHHHRSKKTGWNHTEANMFLDGTYDVTSFDSQIHKNVFYSHVALRPCCHHCRYTNLFRPGDLTMADFWGIEKRLPSFYDRAGVSLLLVNSPKGESILEQIKGSVEIVSASMEDALFAQPHLRYPAKENPNRKKFWQEYRKNGYEAAIQKYAGCGNMQRLKYNIKRVTQAIGVYSYLKRIKDIVQSKS